jgi:putative tRNA adenosine deaminase-associated protein
VSYFAAVLACADEKWFGTEISLDGCESVDDIADVARDVAADVRLLVVEQDDEYAVLARVDGDDQARVFLSDGHAADCYPLAALVADELDEIGGSELDEELAEDTPPAHESAPFGDPAVAADLGTSPAELLALCAREGVLPIDLIAAVCDRAGCSDAFEAVHR